MSFAQRGKVHQGGIIFSEPLNLSDDTEVMVEIAPVMSAPSHTRGAEEFRSLPFFGMWKDREDMADSQAWVRKERNWWHQRPTRPD